MTRRLRGAMILLFGILILSSFPTSLPISNDSRVIDSNNTETSGPIRESSPSSLTGSGNDIESLMTISRGVQGLNIDIMNSYADTSSHEGEMNFSVYQVPGWTLYEILIEASNVTAIAEREVLGVSKGIDSFRIEEYNLVNGWRYTSLAQGFYLQPYDGQLLNYSFYYDSPIYTPAQHGWAYYSVLSDYHDSSSNLVGYTQLPTRVISGAGWQSATVSSVILDADTQYYVTINGSALKKTTYFPDIRWIAENGTGIFACQQYDSRFSLWGSYPCKALLNYTYLPWNTTTNAALVLSDPCSIALSIDGSPVSGSTWTISSENNITALQISTNQSVAIEYELTLKYRKNIVSTAALYADTSGADIIWNITSVLDYPELSGILDKNLTLSIPSDWTAIHLFNEITPTVYHDVFAQDGMIVTCSQLSDATWILECSSPNYVESVHKFDISDGSTIIDKVSATVTLGINCTIESTMSTPAVNGNATLRICHQSTLEYSENVLVSAGESYHQWDIALHSTINGPHMIELYWANGTEVGYYTDEIVVYYPTSLTAETYSIDGFTEDSVEISVYFEDTFTPQGLFGNAASVVYSFAGEANENLTDHNNGTWTAVIPTTGKPPDTYNITVYAEGYAIENQSVIIYTTLVYDTETLAAQWSNTSNISFVETTDLLVEYKRVGNIPIANAAVNVDIDGEAIPLVWDNDLGLYRLTFNGTDVYSGFGTYNLTISAWKEGYKAQVSTSEKLTIHLEFTTFTIDWSFETNITYIECAILTVTYRMSNSSTIPFADVSVTDGNTAWELNWNETDGTYWIKFNGTDSNPGYGTHDLTIHASKFGYQSHENTSYSLTIRKVSTSLAFTWSSGNTITYVQTTTLVVNYTTIDGVPVIDAEVNVTIGSGFWKLNYNPLTETYNLILNGSDIEPGFGNHSVALLAGMTGYDGKSNYSVLRIDLEPTTLSVTWSAGFNISYVQQTTLNVTYLMLDETPIVGAIVNVTINGHMWNLTWDGLTSYLIVFSGSDTLLGFGTHNLTILAGTYGYVNQLETSKKLTLSEESTSVNTEWLGNLSIITYTGSATLIVNYTMSDGLPVEGAVVYATIGMTTWNLTWDIATKTYRWEFHGTDNPPDLGLHVIIINASRFGFVGGYDNATLTIEKEPITLTVDILPSNEFTYMNGCILSVSYIMNSNKTAITDAIVLATIAGVQKQMVWNLTMLTYYLYIDGDTNLPGVGTFDITIEASRYGFDIGYNSSREIILIAEPTSLSVRWANDTSNPDFFSYTYLIVEYSYGNFVPILNATVNVTASTHTWQLTWNVTEGFYQLRFNGSDSIPGVGNHSLIVRAWKYGFIDQMNSDEEVVFPVIPTLLNLAWTNGNTITYVQKTTLQAFYRMYNDTWITDAVVNVMINGITLPLDWNPDIHAYERTFVGTDGSLGFATYPILVMASLKDFQSQTNSTDSLTKELEPTSLLISWIGGNNITYFSETRLSVQFVMSNSSPILTGVFSASINGHLWDFVWNDSSFAYEAVILGNDPRLNYGNNNVTISAFSFGYLPAVDTSENLTIRLEDTYITFEWVPSSTISYLGVTVFRVYYRYLNESPVLNAIVSASYVLLWEADYNSSSGAYEISFTGSDIPTPTLGPHTLFVLASKANHLPQSDITQTLTIVQEDTSIRTSWLNGNNTITYVESATLHINYSITASGLPVVDALVSIRIGTHTWDAVYNATLKLYVYTFTGDMDPPGRGTFVLYISGTYLLHEGFKDAQNTSCTLVILSESVSIQSHWIGGGIITYVGATTLVVNYTMSNGSAIVSASVNVTIGSHSWDLNWDKTSETYRLMFNGSDPLLGLGYHELSIHASRDGFDSLSDSTLSLEIVKEPTTLTPRWSNPCQNNITTNEYTYLFVDYLMSNSSPILDASVNATIGLTTWKFTWNETEGAYAIRFNGSNFLPGPGTHNLVIIASKYGFADAPDLSETLEVLIATTLSISILSSSFYYDENRTLDIYYQISNSSVVPNATISIILHGFEQIAIWETDHWTVVLVGEGLGIGTHNFTIEVFAADYEGQVHIVSITIQPIPTKVIYDADITIYAQDSLTLEFFYLDNRTSAGILGALCFIDWDGSVNVIDLANGTYLVQISGSSLHVGNYTFDMTLQLAGYLNGSGLVGIKVKPIPTELLLTSQISQYENETIIIQARLMDLAHSVTIDWAVITATLEGVEYFLLYDAPTQNYTASIQLPSDISPGVYTISISANGVDCDAKEGVVELDVLQKSTYVLTLDVVDEIETGSELLISVLVQHNGQPAGNVPVTLHIVIFTQSDSRIHTQIIETDDGGVALAALNVPLDARSLEITVLYAGSISVWPAESETSTVQIKVSGLGLLDVILRNPILLSMVVGGVSLPAIGLVALKRRRGTLRHAAESPIAVSSTSSPEKISMIQPIDRLKAEIAESASGLTRPELSERLGISSSKIGSLVRDLLVSDSSFYEVREGTKRIIRKRE